MAVYILFALLLAFLLVGERFFNGVVFGGHFLCTIAAKGHGSLVRPLRAGVRGGKPIKCNRQLLVSCTIRLGTGSTGPGEQDRLAIPGEAGPAGDRPATVADREGMKEKIPQYTRPVTDRKAFPVLRGRGIKI